MAQTSYQIVIDFVQPRSRSFKGWFNGDQVEQAIAAAISAARECGCRLNIKRVEIVGTRRQRGEV